MTIACASLLVQLVLASVSAAVPNHQGPETYTVGHSHQPVCIRSNRNVKNVVYPRQVKFAPAVLEFNPNRHNG